MTLAVAFALGVAAGALAWHAATALVARVLRAIARDRKTWL